MKELRLPWLQTMNTIVLLFAYCLILIKAEIVSEVEENDPVLYTDDKKLSEYYIPAPTKEKWNPNSFDIWNKKEWDRKNQDGIEPGEVKFCALDWMALDVYKNYPKVILCRGHDLLYLTYQVNIQQVYKGTMQELNDNFLVVVTHGDECMNPKSEVHKASQADCYNYDEYNTILGEKCVRRSIVVNTFGTEQACFIIYCGNHKSHCKIWVKSYWNKYMYVNPSHQTLKPPVSHMLISGRNFASNITQIKIKCIDAENRILNCECVWVNEETGEEAIIEFIPSLGREHTGRISIRLDSDNHGWTTSVIIAEIIDEIYPWISITIMFTSFLMAIIPVVIYCIFYTWSNKLYYKTKRRKRELLKDTKHEAKDAIKYQLAGWT